MTFALNKILVAVDFSESSKQALDTASALASKSGASIDIVHVWELPSFLPPTTLIGTPSQPEQPLFEVIRENAARELERFAEDAEGRGIRIDKRLSEEGEPWRAVVEQAKAGGYDLLVLGTMGRTGLMHALLGSVAEKVVRHSPIPVLTVRLKGEAT
jgi:universal stress protein A